MELKNYWGINNEEFLRRKVPLLFLRYTLPQGQTAYFAHNHIQTEVEMVVQGACTQMINGQQRRCTPGTILLMSPFDIHQFTQFEEETELICLCFPEELLAPAVREDLAARGTPLGADYPESEYTRAMAILTQLEQETENELPHKDLAVANRLTDLVIDLLRFAPQKSFPAHGRGRTRRALEFVQAHFTGNISLRETAKAAGLSPQHLSRAFPRITGMSFGDYLRVQRLTYALHLLRATDESVTDICLECGYSSPAHFAAIFHRHFGILPSQVRRVERGCTK